MRRRRIERAENIERSEAEDSETAARFRGVEIVHHNIRLIWESLVKPFLEAFRFSLELLRLGLGEEVPLLNRDARDGVVFLRALVVELGHAAREGGEGRGRHGGRHGRHGGRHGRDFGGI